MKPGHNAQKAMTRKANRSAAFIAVNMGDLDRLNPGMIARCHGVTEAEVLAMIETRRARHEAA